MKQNDWKNDAKVTCPDFLSLHWENITHTILYAKEELLRKIHHKMIEYDVGFLFNSIKS